MVRKASGKVSKCCRGRTPSNWKRPPKNIIPRMENTAMTMRKNMNRLKSVEPADTICKMRDPSEKRVLTDPEVRRLDPALFLSCSSLETKNQKARRTPVFTRHPLNVP